MSGGGEYTGKPRPAVIIQDDHFDTDAVALCPFTTDPTGAPLIRLLIEPDPGAGYDLEIERDRFGATLDDIQPMTDREPGL